MHYNLSEKSDFPEICRRACSDFSITYISERPKQPPVKVKTAEEVATEQKELEIIRADIANAQANLEHIPENARRGLTIDTLRKFGCGYIADWHHPKFRLTGKFSTPTPRLIVPAGDHYLARLTIPIDSFNEKDRQYIKEKQHAGAKFPFNFDAISADILNIVVEGEIDAMSISQAVPSLPVMATSGVAGYQEFVQLVKEKFGSSDAKPQFLIIFDPDDTGRKIAPKFAESLIEACFPAVYRFLSKNTSKTDANDILRGEDGENMLRALITEICASAEPDLTDITDEIRHRPPVSKEQDFTPLEEIPDDLRLSTDQKAVLFSGDRSDYDNACRIISIYGQKIRYIGDVDKWAIFRDGMWVVGDSRNSAIYPFVTDIFKKMCANAANKDEYETAISMKKQRKMSAAVTMMKGVSDIIITQKDLDTHKNLLNCLNGVVDLQTGKLYPHAPELLLTQQCRAIYRPNYHNPTVDDFLKSIQPNDDTRHALLRYAAYGITGECSEEVFLIIDGKGGNGKGTFTGFLLYLAGSYACAFPIEGILLSGAPTDANAPTPAFNLLVNKRIAIADEIPPNSKLNSSVIKRLTGRDFIYIRRLHEEASVLDNPMHTFIFSGNNLPEITDVHDPGILRRLLNIKFTQDFNGDLCNKFLKQQLVEPDALSGMLSLLVENAIEWYQDGLIISPDMRAATKHYLESQDFISEFIAAYCVRRDDAAIPRREFLQKLKEEYATATRGFSEAALTEMIKKLDGITYRTGRGNIKKFYGIGWLDDHSQEEPDLYDDKADVPF